MLVGIISDIHGYLSQDIADELSDVDMILCAGDIERPSILFELQAIAPTIAVYGNCDHYDYALYSGSLASPRIGGVRFRMVHRPEDIGSVPEDVSVVVHGHTHIPRHDVLGDVHYINPGSATRPRGSSKKSIAKVTIDQGCVKSVDFYTWDA